MSYQRTDYDTQMLEKFRSDQKNNVKPPTMHSGCPLKGSSNAIKPMERTAYDKQMMENYMYKQQGYTLGQSTSKCPGCPVKNSNSIQPMERIATDIMMQKKYGESVENFNANIS